MTTSTKSFVFQTDQQRLLDHLLALECLQQVPQQLLSLVTQYVCTNVSSAESFWRLYCVTVGSPVPLAAYLASLPRHVCITDFHPTRMRDDHITAIAQHCPSLVGLSAERSAESGFSDACLRALANCPHLTKLEIPFTTLSNDGVCVLAEHCTQLSELALPHSLISAKGLEAVGRSCPQLTSLGLNGCRLVDDQSLATIVAHCPQLRHLDLQGTSVTDSGMVRHAPQLSSLQTIAVSRLIGDVGLCALAEHCHELTHIGGDCRWTDVSLRAAGRGCPYLAKLNIAGGLWPRMSAAGLEALVRGCPELIDVCVWHNGHISDAVLRALGQNCHKLAVLDVYGCRNITDAGMVELVQGCPWLSKVTLGTWSVVGLTERTLLAIAEKCPELSTLKLQKGCSVSDEVLEALGQGCPGLRSLDVSCSSGYTDAGIKALVRCCPQLTSVVLQSCPIGDDAIISVAQSCPGLTELNLSYLDVTDRAVCEVAVRCPNMRKLWLCGCTQITDVSVQAVAKNCTKLDHLLMEGCISLTEAAVDAVLEAAPPLEWFEHDLKSPGLKERVSRALPLLSLFEFTLDKDPS